MTSRLAIRAERNRAGESPTRSSAEKPKLKDKPKAQTVTARALKKQTTKTQKPPLKVGWWGVLTLKPGVAPLRCYLGQIKAISDDGFRITLQIKPDVRSLYSTSRYPEHPSLHRQPQKLRRPSRQVPTPK
jgi:hypothetical protein